MNGLIFTPALGQIATLRVPPIPSHVDPASHAQTVSFKALFGSPESYLQAKAEGARVEVWTNLPVPGRSDGEWGALQLTEQEPGRAETDGGADLPQSFSLLTSADAEEISDAQEEHAVSLRLSLPLLNEVGSRFEFTYRVVYPSGHTQWLGDHGRNGVLVVEEDFPGVDIGREWAICGSGHLGVESIPPNSVLAEVKDVAEWTVWTWSSSGPRRFAGDIDQDVPARVVILLPRPSARTKYFAEPVVLTASTDLNLRTSAGGSLSIRSRSETSGQATLALLRYSQDLLQKAMPEGLVLACDPSSVIIATRLSNSAMPYHVLVLPVADSEHVSIPWHHLRPLMSQTSSHGLVVYSSTLRKAKVLVASTLNGTDTLVVGSTGAEVTVSPIQIVRDGETSWQVTLLTPFKDMTVQVESAPANHALPTPPPSPPLVRDVANPQSTAGSAPNGSPSDTPSGIATPQAINAQNTPRRPQHRRRSSLALVRNLPSRLLRAYLHTLLNLVFWFWNVFFRTVVVRVLGQRLSHQLSTLLGTALRKTGLGTRSLSSVRSVGGSLGRDASFPSSERGASARAEANSAELATPTPNTNAVPVVSPHPQPSAPKYHGGTPRAVLSATTIGNHHPLPFVVLRGSGAPRDVRATLDGKPLSVASVTPVDDEAHLVEFAFLVEGHLEVSFDL